MKNTTVAGGDGQGEEEEERETRKHGGSRE